MKFTTALIILVILLLGGAGYYLYSTNKPNIQTPNPLPPATPTPTSPAVPSPTPTPDTQQAIQAFLAQKYQKPLSEVHVTVDKQVQGFASGSVLFGQGGPGEGGMWLAAVLANNWQVVWDGNGNVDCNQMRQQYGFPDTILKPNFCD